MNKDVLKSGNYTALANEIFESSISIHAKMVFWALSRMDYDTIFVRIDKLSKKTRISPQSVRRGLKELERASVINIIRRGHLGKSNIYEIKERKYWELSFEKEEPPTCLVAPPTCVVPPPYLSGSHNNTYSNKIFLKNNIYQLEDAMSEATQRAKELLGYWKSLGLTQHRETPYLLNFIERGIKNRESWGFNLEATKKAMENYSIVMKTKDCWYTASYGITKFLEDQKSNRFYPEEFNSSQYPPGSKPGMSSNPDKTLAESLFNKVKAIPSSDRGRFEKDLSAEEFDLLCSLPGKQNTIYCCKEGKQWFAIKEIIDVIKSRRAEKEGSLPPERRSLTTSAELEVGM